MPNNLTNHAEDLILKWLMTDEVVTRPTAWFIALFSSDPGEATGGSELAGNGYARQAADFGVDGKSNTGLISFTAVGGDWLEATHMVITDHVSAGNRLWAGPLAAPKLVEDGDSLTFPIGNIDLALE